MKIQSTYRLIKLMIISFSGALLKERRLKSLGVQNAVSPIYLSSTIISK